MIEIDRQGSPRAQFAVMKAEQVLDWVVGRCAWRPAACRALLSSAACP